MKIKFLASSLFVAGAVMASSPASAWSLDTTLGAWALAPVIDSDNDMKWTLLDTAGGLSPDTPIHFSEDEIGGKDFYDVGVSFSPTLTTGAGLSYLMEVLTVAGEPLESITSVKLDSVVTGFGTVATKDLYDIGAANSFLTLTSTDGSNTGYQSIAPRLALRVVDTFNPGQNGGIDDAHNGYTATATVSEPVTLVSLGIGLAAIGVSRRRTAPNFRSLQV